MVDVVGHHLDEEGRFQSDKYPDLAPDKIVLSLHDPAAFRALAVFIVATDDRELASDLATRMLAMQELQDGMIAEAPQGVANDPPKPCR